MRAQIIATLAALTVLCILALPAGAAVVVFDMGSAQSALWPEAQAVTPQDVLGGARQIGWSSGEGLSVSHKAWTTLVENTSRGTQDPPPIWTNPLTEDSVVGDRPASFVFPAAVGPWRVYVRCGVSAGSFAQYWDFDVTLDGQAWICQIEGPYRFLGHTFSVTSEGRLELGLTPRSKWCLAGVVAWQPADEAQAQALIAKIEQWAPDEELSKWKEDPRPSAGAEPPVTQAEQARGFYLWHRHWGQIVYPWTNPTPEEKVSTLRVFAAPGEYEPLTFTVRPLRDLGKATVKVEAIGPVAPDNVEVRKVRFLAARPHYVGQYRYRIVPDILDRWESGPLAAGENARFWLTLRVPEMARPGQYRGRIVFTADGQSMEIPVLLRVVGVKLQEDPQHTYAIYYRHSLDQAFGAPDEASRRYWERKAELEHADMVAHGTRNVTLSCWFREADEQGNFDTADAFARLDTKLKLAERFGFQPPFVMGFNTGGIYYKHMKERFGSHLSGVKAPPEAFFAEITAMVRTIEEERKRRGWPDFVYYPIDEPSASPEAVAFMVGVLKAVRAAGVRTYVTADPTNAGFEPMRPFVDVWCTQPFLPERDVLLADMKARSVEYWCYPNHINGENDHTPVAGARMTYGFGFWRSGFLRLIPWIYQSSTGDPFNYLDGAAMDFLNRSEPDGAPLPVALWEAYREGYDDYRYIYTLQQLIKKAQASTSREARQEAAVAEKTLDFVWQTIPVLPKYKYEGFWSPEEMDVYRWLIARRAERLTKLLR